jgi:toxin ParE1/3/4
MPNYKISNLAKEDLIRIHKFGMIQADKYFDSFFKNFEIIAENPFYFESVDYVKTGYRSCISGTDSIYYKVNGNIVEIMAIIGRQDLKNIL